MDRQTGRRMDRRSDKAGGWVACRRLKKQEHEEEGDSNLFRVLSLTSYFILEEVELEVRRISNFPR